MKEDILDEIRKERDTIIKSLQEGNQRKRRLKDNNKSTNQSYLHHVIFLLRRLLKEEVFQVQLIIQGP